MSKHKIDKYVRTEEHPMMHMEIYNRISDGMERELLRQKAAGKKFITDAEIDKLIDDAIKESLL